MFLTSFLLSLPVLVSAISSGRVSDCFITPDYGCPAGQYEIENGVENRLKCKIPSRIMAWVTEPINKPEWYTLFAGSNEAAPVTTYVPGQRMTIGLRVKAYNQQFRGLLMYAYKGTSKEEKVGEWDFVDRDTLFHSWCPQSVLHAGANLKPYLSQWVFTAPPKGTGQISIWALLKIGVANEGEFYYPNLLTLNEATTEPPAQVWYRASKFGQSCDEVCNENCGKTCDATQLQALDTPDKFEAAAAAFYTCAKPYLTRCGVEGATSGNDSTCYYHSQAACQRVNLPFTAATCGAKPTNAALGFRLCPCTGGQTPCAPRTTPAPITTTVTRRTLATNAPGATNAPAPIDPCLTTTQCASGCPCPSPRVCQPGLTLKEGVCLAAGACDVAEPGNGCPCTDKCGTATVAGQTENLACKAGFCTLVLRRTCDDHLGTAGCWCTEKRTCDAGLICSSKNNNCVLDEECAPGSQGCTCMQGKCNDGLACSRVAGGTFCLVEEDAIGTNPDSASALVLSLASIAVVLLSMM